MKPVRTRFAPSPTGFLHVGGVRTALFNYLLAKKHGGQFILRLEDTDRERFVPEGVEQIVESLDWLGLRPDEGFWIGAGGEHQNIEFVQSERHKQGFYKQFADQLVEQGLAYADWTTSERLAELRQQARADKKPFLFRKSLAAAAGDENQPHVIRLDLAACAKQQPAINWQDTVRGNFSADPQLIEDFILLKSDGFPTYNFANVIDDHDMRVSHVVRGDEFISSTAKHALLYDIFGWPRPAFVHLPVINGADGKKLSKRTGDTNTLDYRHKGYLPETLLNFLALLGWNDGSQQEIYELAELIEKFDLAGVGSSPAVFDQRRLDWMNGAWIRDKIELDDLYERSRNFWPAAAKDYDDDYKKKVLAIVRERLKYFAELPALTEFFFVDLPINESLIIQHKQLKKLSKAELRDLLQQSKTSLEASDFTVRDLTDRLNNLLTEADQKPAILFSLIRVATTQAPASPGLADTLAVLGKDRSLARLDQQLAAL
ncbi:MAG TPA: glutamate--tRNA ligase [Candidatus Saccharimonadales bacterium]|nr:glutamate--tRNA ligase [Candidatus Saccharimonadales bacterium]